jgi:hypothetical protein
MQSKDIGRGSGHSKCHLRIRAQHIKKFTTNQLSSFLLRVVAVTITYFFFSKWSSKKVLMIDPLVTKTLHKCLIGVDVAFSATHHPVPLHLQSA